MAKLLKSLTTKIKKEDGTTTENEYTVVNEWKHLGESETGGDTLTWDGNTEGLVSAMGVFYKVSSIVPTKEELLNGVSIFMNGNLMGSLGTDDMSQAVLEDGFTPLDIVFIVPTDNYSNDGAEFPEKGIYFLNDGEGSICTGLTINGYTCFPSVKPIDSKYLPKALQFGVDYSNGVTLADNKTYTYSADNDAYMVDFSIEPNCVYKVVCNGVEYELVSQTFTQELGGVYYIGNGAMLGLEDNGLSFFISTMDMSAIGYGILNMMATLNIPNDETITVIKYGIKKIDDMYINKVEPTYFYCALDSNNPYIYKEVTCNTKVSSEEFETAMKKGVVYISVQGVLNMLPILTNITLGQSYTTIQVLLDGAVATLYTAEYTG